MWRLRPAPARMITEILLNLLFFILAAFGILAILVAGVGIAFIITLIKEERSNGQT